MQVLENRKVIVGVIAVLAVVFLLFTMTAGSKNDGKYMFSSLTDGKTTVYASDYKELENTYLKVKDGKAVVNLGYEKIDCKAKWKGNKLVLNDRGDVITADYNSADRTITMDIDGYIYTFKKKA